MSCINCALCPAQANLYGHHEYSNGDYYVEYRCISKHKTYIEKEKIDGSRILAEPGEVTGHCC